MSLAMSQCGLWFVGVGFVTRRDPGTNKKTGDPTYACDLMVGDSKEYIKLTAEQYASIPPEGMEADIRGRMGKYDGSVYYIAQTVKPWSDAPVTPKARI